MAKYRNALPQTSGSLFVTDGGIETTLIFREGIALPEFAAFVLMQDEAGTRTLERYFRDYGALAQRYGVGLILESPTWRANRDWGRKLGFSEGSLADINTRSIELLAGILDSIEVGTTRAVISGCVGPRADGYVPSAVMTVDEAADYHRAQIDTFSRTEADMVDVLTMNYIEEAVGVALAARASKMPVAVSFTVETDGRLPTGDTLREAIGTTDELTGGYPAYYMINCAHPLHFGQSFAPAGEWLSRIQGLRANASKMSHAELNDMTTLDDGDPTELADHYRDLIHRLPGVCVLGGCCGTDRCHIEQICRAVLS